jgi:hypothetical protein
MWRSHTSGKAATSRWYCENSLLASRCCRDHTECSSALLVRSSPVSVGDPSCMAPILFQISLQRLRGFHPPSWAWRDLAAGRSRSGILATFFLVLQASK